MVNKIYVNFTVFRAVSRESTAAPGEETTAVPPGKATDNMEGAMKIFFIIVFLGFSVFFISVVECSIRLMPVVFVSSSHRGKH